VIANAIAALTGLARAEPLRDIQAVYDRNDTIERLRGIMLQVERDFREGRDPFAHMRELPADAANTEVDKDIGACAMFHRAYSQLRAEIVADDLTSLVARLGEYRSEEMLEMVRTFVKASDTVEQEARSSLEHGPESLRALKRALGEVAVNLRKLGRELRRPSHDPEEPTPAQKAVRDLGVDLRTVTRWRRPFLTVRCRGVMLAVCGS
jgi:hypothetical protein